MNLPDFAAMHESAPGPVALLSAVQNTCIYLILQRDAFNAANARCRAEVSREDPTAVAGRSLCLRGENRLWWQKIMAERFGDSWASDASRMDVEPTPQMQVFP